MEQNNNNNEPHPAKEIEEIVPKGWGVAKMFQQKKLLMVINSACALSIFFFGYDQGMMGGVNTSADYAELMGFGYRDEASKSVVVTNSLLQGGIVAVYYLGTLFGAFMGGWVGDKQGRIKTIALGAIWAVFGACFQCSAQNHGWMICARALTGIGTGILNAIVPVWATEVANHDTRGAFVAMEFCLNIFGVAVAYWLEFGLAFIDDGKGAFQWRFPIAFQIIPLFVLFGGIWFFPESPRWLCKMDRFGEAKYVLGKLRGKDKARSELKEIMDNVEEEKKESGKNSYWNMFFDFGKSGKLHTGRRVQLVIWLQVVQEWVGIAGVTVYAPTIFKIAGFDSTKSGWLSGLNDTTYMLAVILCIYTIDRLGRRMTLYWGAIGQGISMFLVGGMSRGGLNATAVGDTNTAAAYGAAAASFVFIYTAVFGATWLTVPWLYPAEIFPTYIRAKGNAWGVVGWSIGNGWLTLLCPVMFDHIGEKTFYIFGACNILAIPMVYLFYPETAKRTLEQIDSLFAVDSILASKGEQNFRKQYPEESSTGDKLNIAERGTAPTRRSDSAKDGVAANQVEVMSEITSDQGSQSSSIGRLKEEQDHVQPELST